MKTVLITDSSRGISLGFVKEYIKNGYKVLATCRNPGRASDLKSTLAENNQPSAIALDVLSDESIFKAAEEVSKIVDSIDILIINTAAKNYPNDSAIKLIDVFFPLVRKGTGKKLIDIRRNNWNISGALHITNYCASDMVTRHTSLELKDVIDFIDSIVV